jgi:hypothetical protein
MPRVRALIAPPHDERFWYSAQHTLMQWATFTGEEALMRYPRKSQQHLNKVGINGRCINVSCNLYSERS